MAYGLQVDGAGSWWDTNSTFDTPVYPETVTQDIATQSQYVQTTASNDSWTGWFRDITKDVLAYSLKKDAVITGAEVQKTLQTPVYQQQQQPLYLQSGAAGTSLGISSNMLLLIAAGVGVYLLASK